jgi:O-antigen/teichoic acid export membrane protein
MGAAPVAMYSLATSPVEQLSNLAGNIFTLAAPKLAVKDPEEMRRIIPIRMLQMFLVVVPVTLVYIIAAPFIFKIFFPKYVSVIFYTQIYSLILLLQPRGFIDAAFIAQENTGARAWVVSLGQGLKIVFLAIGIWAYGILGGIFALIASEVFNGILDIVVFMYRRRQLAK